MVSAAFTRFPQPTVTKFAYSSVFILLPCTLPLGDPDPVGSEPIIFDTLLLNIQHSILAQTENQYCF